MSQPTLNPRVRPKTLLARYNEFVDSLPPESKAETMEMIFGDVHLDALIADITTRFPSPEAREFLDSVLPPVIAIDARVIVEEAASGSQVGLITQECATQLLADLDTGSGTKAGEVFGKLCDAASSAAPKSLVLPVISQGLKPGEVDRAASRLATLGDLAHVGAELSVPVPPDEPTVPVISLVSCAAQPVTLAFLGDGVYAAGRTYTKAVEAARNVWANGYAHSKGTPFFVIDPGGRGFLPSSPWKFASGYRSRGIRANEYRGMVKQMVDAALARERANSE